MNNVFTKAIVILLGLLLALSVESACSADESTDATTMVSKKPIYLAAFFPGGSTFSQSRLKNRITRRQTRKNKRKKVNRVSFLKFIETEQMIIEAATNVKKNRLLVYWQLGEVLTKETERHKNQKGYNDYLVHNLSAKTDVSENDLKNIIIFYNNYKIASFISLELSWEHYKVLLTVKDAAIRDFYEKYTVRKSVSPKKLQNLINQKIHETVNEKL